MTHTRSIAAAALVAVACSLASRQTPVSRSATPVAGLARAGLAPTPPMGWNSWNKFHCNITEQLIRETADAMVSSGMRDAGYVYLNIDDCWEAPARDAKGDLATDSTHFPSGMKALADYVHSKGLKLGIYSSAGTGTCEKRPASLDHEIADARTFAEWGIDYLKYDNCNNDQRPALDRYGAMGKALHATGRPIVYSLCEWGQNKPWTWGRTVGAQLWRTTGENSRSAGGARALLGAECLERSRHARSGQWSHDERRIHRALQPLVADERAAHRRQ